MIRSELTTLPNGLRVVAVPMPALHCVELAIYLKVGGRHDPASKAGLSHFLEHMLFRGTARHATSLELESAFEAIGGSVNASTDEECTCYFTRLHPAHVAEGINLFAAMLLTPSLEGVETEKRIITEEALEDLNEHGEEINPHNLASRLLWPDHPLGRPTLGFLDSIGSFERVDLTRHLADHYLPNNAVLVAAGALEPARIFAAAAASLGGWQPAPAVAPLPAPPVSQQSPGQLFVSDPDSQVHLQLACRAFHRYDPKLMPLRLLRRLLTGGGTSRLHLNLRERLGIVYSVDSSVSAYADVGSFAIELSTAPENLELAVSEVLAEIRRLVTEPVPADELARVRQGYVFDLEYSRDSGYEMQVRYGWGELMGLVRDIEEDVAEAAAVTPQHLQETARELFAPASLNLVAVGAWDKGGRQAVERLLAAYAAGWAQ